MTESDPIAGVPDVGKPFVVVDLPLQGLVTGEFALAHPGVRIDALQTANAMTGGVTTACLVQGATPEALTELEAKLKARYGNAQRVDADGPAFVVRVAPEDLHSRVFRDLVRFGPSANLWWHIMQPPRHTLYAEVDDADLGRELANRLSAFYQKAGIAVNASLGILPEAERNLLAQRRALLRLLR